MQQAMKSFQVPPRPIQYSHIEYNHIFLPTEVTYFWAAHKMIHFKWDYIGIVYNSYNSLYQLWKWNDISFCIDIPMFIIYSDIFIEISEHQYFAWPIPYLLRFERNKLSIQNNHLKNQRGLNWNCSFNSHIRLRGDKPPQFASIRTIPLVRSETNNLE